MREPPTQIDGATVIQFADLAAAMSTGATRHVVKGEEVKNFAALAIASYESDAGIYLFYCDSEWRCLTDTYHESIEGAIAQAEFEFGHLQFVERSRDN